MKKLDAEKSLCYTCKYGMCIQEEELQHIIPQIAELPNTRFVDEEEDMFGVGEEEIIQGEHMHFVAKRVQAICYWRPYNVKDAPPVRVGEVSQCSRYDNGTNEQTP
jgi:hypothetical protein